jgi:hypothetical protein
MAITVDGDYPGGNVLVRRIEDGRLVVEQDRRDTTEWWFWWNFRVRGAAGRTLTVEFADQGGPVGPNGPAMSLDRRHWRWAWQADGRGPCSEHDRRHFVIRVPRGADTVYLAFSFPYQLEDFQRFAARFRRCRDLRVTTLATTRAGRRAPLITIGRSREAKYHVLFCCRHHACESVASFVLEGAIEWILSREGEVLRRSTGLTVVPFVDLDGVEAGDQGKSRAPHDHNRDYTPSPIYPTVAAVERIVDDLSRRGLAVYLDFHCPWIRRGANEAAFLVEPPEPHAAHLRELSGILRRTNDSPIPFTGRFDLPSGVDWNVSEPGRPTSTSYVCRRDTGSLLLAATLETSYSLAEGVVVTPEGARRFGRAVGRAMAEFLARHV